MRQALGKQLFRGEGESLLKTLLKCHVGPRSREMKSVSFLPGLVFKYGPALQVVRIVGGCLYQVNTIKTIFYYF